MRPREKAHLYGRLCILCTSGALAYCEGRGWAPRTRGTQESTRLRIGDLCDIIAARAKRPHPPSNTRHNNAAAISATAYLEDTAHAQTRLRISR